MHRRSRKALAAIGTAAALLLTGCGFTGIYDLPLPGGADIGDDPFEVTVELRDVLDLVPQTHVKINEVAVGRVDRIRLAEDGWHSEVTVRLHGDVDLPANAFANIKMSSLLGEKYIELVQPPDGTAEGTLSDGDTIPLARTSRNTEIEEVLGALSMLLNGGGVEQLNTITQELNKVYEGAGEAELKTLLHKSEEFVAALDGQTDNISTALDGLNGLSRTLDAEKETIADALDDLAPGMQVLVDQREDLVEMLAAMDRLSTVAIRTMNASQADLVDNLNALRPILQNLADSGDSLPNALQLMVSFPFADSAVEMVKGDYANLYADFEIDLEAIMTYFQRERDNPLPGAPIVDELPIGEGELIDPGALPLSLDQLPLPLRSNTTMSDTTAEVLSGLLGGGR